MSESFTHDKKEEMLRLGIENHFFIMQSNLMNLILCNKGMRTKLVLNESKHGRIIKIRKPNQYINCSFALQNQN